MRSMSGIKRLRSHIFKTMIMVAGAIYLLFSIGVMKATHFCMGREAYTAYFSSETHSCACSLFAKENEKHGCCNNENDLIKINDDQKTISTYTIRIPQLFILDDLYTVQLVALLPQCPSLELTVKDDLPPPSVPIFVSNCSFVFYDSEG
jgi:hypothetical protein